MEKNKTIKSLINKILIVIFLCTPIVSIILMVVGNSNDESFYSTMGIAIYPILGIIAIPNIIKYAIKDYKTDEKEYDSRKKYFDSHHVTIDNIDKYYNKVKKSLLIKSILDCTFVIGVVLWLSWSTLNWYQNGGVERLDDRPIISKVIRPSSKVEGGAFTTTLILLIFGIPGITYTVATSIYRLYLFKKKKISGYKIIVDYFDLKDNIHVKSLKDALEDKNKYKKHEKYKYMLTKNRFKYYKCIGIRKKEIINQEVIVIFIPGYAFFLNE